MLSSNCEPSQVRLRMINDGVAAPIIDMFLGGPASGLQLDLSESGEAFSLDGPPSASYTSPKQGASSAVYTKLLASGVPTTSVRQKMARVSLHVLRLYYLRLSQMYISTSCSFFRAAA
jgi:hypothetical protein